MSLVTLRCFRWRMYFVELIAVAAGRRALRHRTAAGAISALHFLSTPQKSSKALKWDFEIRLYVNAARFLPFAFSQIPGFYPAEEASLVEHAERTQQPPVSLKLSQ